MKAPDFWKYGSNAALSTVLSPISCLYNMISAKRANKAASYRAKVPVICVGNLIMGGAGKTPSAIAIAQELIDQEKKVVFLSRGYGGTLSGPLLVEDHSPKEVGDEPKLLQATAPVCISQDRVAGAKFCEEQGFDVIIMDDGYQNPSLHKDLSFLVIDGGYGHGNEKVFPSGPLREDLESGLKRADAIILIGEDDTQCLARIHKLAPDLPVLNARIRTKQKLKQKGVKTIAFAGIARPEKFYQTARGLGFQLCATVDFKDHHTFSAKDLKQLHDLAERYDAALLTTEKDWVRLPEEMQKQVDYVKISLAWEQENMLNAVLRSLDVK